MSFWQVVEKDGFGTDWAAVRYNEKALIRFATREEAMEAAVSYITDRNCNNPLTKDEKFSSIECFMQTEKGCFLGILDGEEWYITYPKDVMEKGKIKYAKGDPIRDTKHHLLEDKTEVSVRILPGT